jgi:hypothetical protein
MFAGKDMAEGLLSGIPRDEEAAGIHSRLIFDTAVGHAFLMENCDRPT